MPRLDCPSVSAETPGPENPNPSSSLKLSVDEETLADFKLKVFDTFFATTEESPKP